MQARVLLPLPPPLLLPLLLLLRLLAPAAPKMPVAAPQLLQSRGSRQHPAAATQALLVQAQQAAGMFAVTAVTGQH